MPQNMISYLKTESFHDFAWQVSKTHPQQNAQSDGGSC